MLIMHGSSSLRFLQNEPIRYYNDGHWAVPRNQFPWCSGHDGKEKKGRVTVVFGTVSVSDASTSEAVRLFARADPANILSMFPICRFS